jgi:hypothetical protein
VLALAHYGFKVVNAVRHVLVGQDQANDVDVSASREAINNRISHLFLPVLSLLPEGLGGFLKCLLAGQAEVIQQVLVLGEVAESLPQPEPGRPT